MSALLEWPLIALCFVGAGVFGATEIALYRLSRVRLDMEARAGDLRARLAQRMLRDETALLIACVLGVNLCTEASTWRIEALLEERGVPAWAGHAVFALVVTPATLLLCELLPKELARRRPQGVLRLAVPAIAAVRVLLWPLERALWLVATSVSRAAGGTSRFLVEAQGREAVLDFIQEGRKSGAIAGHAEQMARNVLKLRAIPVERCMVAWTHVTRLSTAEAPADQYARVAAAGLTRIPVVDPQGAVLGYVHQLDVLGEGEGTAPVEHLRPVTFVPTDLPVDRALARMRAAGQRLAVVGPREAPVGIVTLKDLLEEISGDLPRW